MVVCEAQGRCQSCCCCRHSAARCHALVDLPAGAPSPTVRLPRHLLPDCEQSWALASWQTPLAMERR